MVDIKKVDIKSSFFRFIVLDTTYTAITTCLSMLHPTSKFLFSMNGHKERISHLVLKLVEEVYKQF